MNPIQVNKNRILFRLKKSWKNNVIGYMFLLPWFIGVFVLTIGPMASSLYLSFTDYDILTPPKWIGLANYIEMFTDDPHYMNSLKVTFTYVFISVPLQLSFALFIAMLLNQGLKGLGLYRTVYYIPSLLGGSVAIATLWRQIFGSDGLVNQLLYTFFGIEAPSWIANPDYALYSIILLSTWKFGASMIIFLAGLKQIPTEYYEASKIDGAGKLGQFRYITIPLLTPVIFFNLVIEVIGTFQAFTQAFIISNGTGGPLDSTLFYTLYLYQKGFLHWEMGYASAMAWVLLLIISVFTALLFFSSKYWVNYGDGGK